MSDRRELRVSGNWVAYGFLAALFLPLLVCCVQQKTGIQTSSVILAALPGLATMFVSRKVVVDRVARQGWTYWGYLGLVFQSKAASTFTFDRAILHAHWDRNRIVLFYWAGVQRVGKPIYLAHDSTNGSALPGKALEMLDWLGLPCDLDSYGERNAQPEVKAKLASLGAEGAKDFDGPAASPELEVSGDRQTEPK